MAMKKLYVHIGCHKTGTTSIQHNLAQNAEALAKYGLTFFYDNCYSGEQLLPDLHSWLNFVEAPGKVVPQGLYVRELDKLADRLARIQGDVIVSSENFSFFFEPAPIGALQAALSPIFGQIRIICYLRRQDRHAISHHQEGSKFFRAPEGDLFGHSTYALPPFDPRHRLYLDYHRRLSMWAQAFGADNMVVKVFDRKQFPEGDVVADFFSLLGISEYQKVADRNVSLSLREAKIGHVIAGSELKNKPALASVLRACSGDPAKLVPSRAAAQAYYAQFADSNAALAKMFGLAADGVLFDEDFSDYPEQAQDAWTEESANSAILNLLRYIDATQLTPDELRDTAAAIGKTQPAIAVKLLRIALRLRPEGKVIKKRLAEFEKLLAEQTRKSAHIPALAEPRLNESDE